ncbi:MAG: hypothetical protein D6778_02925 [Nitrospirae bacterium]|nr:MAG: hypothetical protein D6778_02925 [Nitrospirota bacterium]
MSVITRARVFVEMEFSDRQCLVEALRETGCVFKEQGNIIDVSTPEAGFRLRQGPDGWKAEFTVQKWDGIETPESKTNRQAIMKLLTNLQDAYQKALQEKIERLRREQLKRACDEEAQRLMTTEQKEKEEAELAIKRRQLERTLRKIKRQKQKEIEKRLNEIKSKAKKLGYQVQEEEAGSERRLVLIKSRQ